ncbi:MAG: T9SS type A sorting domain-containing protein [Bacteroidota bacterium]
MKRRLLFFGALVITMSSYSQFALVKDINPSGSSDPSHFIEFQNELYFYATGPVGNSNSIIVDVFKTDGTSVGTLPITPSTISNPIPGTSFPAPMMVSSNLLYYYREPLGISRPTAIPNVPGGLWSYNGNISSYIFINNARLTHSIFEFNGDPYFGSYLSNAPSKSDIYYIPGGGAVTQGPPARAWHLGIDDFQTNGVIEYNNSIITSIGTMSGTPFLFYRDEELWKINPDNTLTLIKNINTAVINSLAGSSFPRDYTVFNGLVFFSANDNVDNREVWFTDGTNAGTQKLTEINASGSADPRDFIVFNNKLFFTADDGDNGLELWATDGSENTNLIANIGGFNSSEPKEFFVFDGELFFTALSGAIGRELFKVDASDTVTLVKDINAGLDGSDPQDFVIYNNKMYFSAETGGGRELFVSDGSPSGTVLVGEINTDPNVGSNPEHLFVWNNKLYFAANDSAVNGQELWSYTDPVLTVGDVEFSRVSLSPNPAKTTFKINGLDNETTVTIFDITGKRVLSIDNYIPESLIDTERLKTGLYLVQVSGLNGNETYKLLID